MGWVPTPAGAEWEECSALREFDLSPVGVPGAGITPLAARLCTENDEISARRRTRPTRNAAPST